MSNKILIIDDEKIFVDLVADILKAHKYTVETANSVDSALAVLESYTPDVVLLDVKLPYKSEGLDFLQQFRNIPKFSETPVIILSAKVQLHEINAGMEAGATLYLCKPMLIEDVIDQIERFLKI